MHKLPYVVSLDADLLIAKWANESKGFFSKPAPELMSDLRQLHKSRLESLFEDVHFLGGDSIAKKLNQKLEEINIPIISLDRVYTSKGEYLGVTRAVNADMSDRGITHRSGSVSILEQIDRIGSQLQGDVALVDDVVFSGNFIANDLLPMLQGKGLNVKLVVAAVGITSGLEQVLKHVSSVEALTVYDAVVDEVCERDFFPGIELCGRTLSPVGNIGVPYILPFGKPDSWASIPLTECVSFSRHCLELAQELFAGVESSSNRLVRYVDIPRKFNRSVDPESRYVDVLQKIKSSL